MAFELELLHRRFCTSFRSSRQCTCSPERHAIPIPIGFVWQLGEACMPFQTARRFDSLVDPLVVSLCMHVRLVRKGKQSPSPLDLYGNYSRLVCLSELHVDSLVDSLVVSLCMHVVESADNLAIVSSIEILWCTGNNCKGGNKP
jgi:hypothetical protein